MSRRVLPRFHAGRLPGRPNQRQSDGLVRASACAYARIGVATREKDGDSERPCAKCQDAQVNATPALPTLSGGPRLTGGTLADLASPSRELVWRHLRALRHQPPGYASGGERRRVFGAALEQAQQLFAAAVSVDHASQPILLFYGLSQAGRAIAACSTTADKNAWRLSGHGIDVPELDQRPPLPDVAVADNGKGSFTQLAPLLR